MKIYYWTAFVSIFLFLQTSCSGGSDDAVKGGEGDKPKTETFTKVYNTGLSYYSKTLGELVSYSVLLPKEYLTDNTRSFGVVFLYHGWGGSSNDWGPTEIDIQSVAEKMVAAGKVRPLIYVMPSCGNSYFCNRFDGKRAIMDMIVKELVPEIDKRFRTTAKAQERCVMGYSMGGFGAISTAMQNSDVFKTCVALSPSMNTDEQYIGLSQDGWNLQWGANFGGSGTKGNSRLTDYYLSQCPLHFMKDKSVSTFNAVRFFVDCGDDEERLYAGSAELHNTLCERGVYHEYRVRNGAHTTSYWKSSLNEVLEFIESSFNNTDYRQSEPVSFEANDNSTKVSLDFGGVNINIYKPKNYIADNSYKVIYTSYGNGAAIIQDDDIAQSLDSLLDIKKLVIVSFPAAALVVSSKSIVDVQEYVEQQLGITIGYDNRMALVYGSKGELLYNQTIGDNATISKLYAVDANFGSDFNGPDKSSYYLNIADGGSNYKSMSELFIACRNAGVNVQYRVTNGTDDKNSIMNGIHLMCSFISQYLKAQ